MVEREVIILEEGVTAAETAAAGACCRTGPATLRTAPDPSAG